ncbi:hypothetical protein NP493_313g05038 [Ridgeia piscesae]|uniref:Uncharacterized protein n=1 Tax=Ridgeia piscesae TaxID=27915 RepID=A0AAD9L4X6_RIDPI|nr:hypothetical protein NP493_313g05038 [Ridgeia piscesae]
MPMKYVFKKFGSVLSYLLIIGYFSKEKHLLIKET